MLFCSELQAEVWMHGFRWRYPLFFLLVTFLAGCASSGNGIVGQWEGEYPSADVIQFSDDGALLIAGSCSRGTFEQATPASVAVRIDDQTTVYTVIRDDARLILIDALGHERRYVRGGSRARDALVEGCANDDEEHDELARETIRLTMRDLKIYHAGRKSYVGYDVRKTEGADSGVRVRFEAAGDKYSLRASHEKSSNEYFVIVRADSAEDAEVQLVPQGY
jgi:hypothetical protein